MGLETTVGHPQPENIVQSWQKDSVRGLGSEPTPVLEPESETQIDLPERTRILVEVIPMQTQTRQTQTRIYTPEEYLELEAAADYKSEYRDGEIVPMTGGTTNHNEIAGNLYAHLKFALRGQTYKVYIGDVRLWVPRYRQYTYPDIMVVQGQPIYTGTNTTTITNPQIIVEVLSPSTQNYDQGDKFMYYRSIPEMREYILIDQRQFYVMQHTKTSEGKWLLTEYAGEESILELDTIEFQIAFQDLYQGVDFSNIEAFSEE